MLAGVIGSYQWLYPKDGGPWQYRLIEDYDALRREGLSLYPDCHDLNEPDKNILPEPYTANDNTLELTAPDNRFRTYTCDRCNAVFHHHLPYGNHRKNCV